MEDNINKQNFILEKILDKAKDRGAEYKYPIRMEDIPKMPRFRDTDFRYRVVDEAYNHWRADVNNKSRLHKFNIRDFQRVWKYIADELFAELENNFQGVRLPEQLGEMYIGVPPDLEYYVIVNRPNHKHIVWRNKVKYCNVNLRYCYFSTFHKRYRSATLRDDFYKTAKEKIHIFHNKKTS